MSRQPSIPIVELDPEQAAREFPVSGQIGHGAVERRFCRLAREAIRAGRDPCGVPIVEVALCPELTGFRCGLTGCRFLCLFTVPSDAQWERIRADIALGACTAEKETSPTPASPSE